MVTTATQLQQLREGDRLKYHGVQWHVKDYSTYTDVNGYAMEEWLLKSNTGKEYYLLREVDQSLPETPVQWYLAEELRNPILYEPGTSRDVLMLVGQQMRSHESPYPELQLYNRVYAFESQTEGDYESDGSRRYRITWDYWDSAHLWNLALEAWSDGTLVVYSTRTVQPADFTAVQGRDPFSAPTVNRSQSVRSLRDRQILIAWIVVILGFCLMMAGV